MVDRRNPVSLSVSLAAVSVLVLCFALILIVSCGTPTVDAPQTVSPTPPDDSTVEVVPTPTDAAKATSPVQGEAEALLGRWASDEDLVLELGSNGVFTLSHGIDQLDTGTWSLQDDGSFALEGKRYVAVPHGNLLTLDGGTDASESILYRVGDDGALLPYEPANPIAVPPIDFSAGLAITIIDSWTGLSPAAPIRALFRLQPSTGCFTGTAEFSAGGYSGSVINRSVPITVPLTVIEDFIDLIESTPLDAGEYKPVLNYTDDYPTLRIEVEGKAGRVVFSSESQGDMHIPWRVQIAGPGPLVTYSGIPAEALDLLDPYLAREVQEAMVNSTFAPRVSFSAMPGGYLEKALALEYAGTEVTVDGRFTSHDAELFAESMKAFEDATGITVKYSGGEGFETRLSVTVEAGNPPDIIDFAQPGMAENYARQGYIVDPTTWISEDWLQQQYHQSWLDMAMVTGPDGNKMMGGVWHRFNTSSLVWYPKQAWDAAGYQIPQTWAELLTLTQEIADDGYAAWCIGIESDAATGWVATDWTEEMMLRTTSLENYDAWVRGELMFDSPEVKNAIQTWSNIWFNEDYVYGGRDSIVRTYFGDAPAPMFEDPPKCWLHRQANWIPGFFPAGSELGVDYDFFYFPPVDEAYGKPFLVSGDMMVMFNDRPEVRALMEYFTTPQSISGWLQYYYGGALAAHKTATPEMYRVGLEGRIAELVLDATSFRFDGSALMPTEVGAGSFWTGMIDYVSGAADLDTILKEIDSSWPQPTGRGAYCVESQIASLVWDTGGGGDMRFVVDRDKAGYRIRVERYQFEPIDTVIALTDANPRVLELVDDIFSKEISIGDYTRIPAEGELGGTWTGITVICSDKQEVEIHHIQSEAPLWKLYDFVYDAVQASVPTP